MFRHYLDVVEMRSLTEKQDYIGMFTDFVGDNEPAKQAIEKYISWARKTLKKNDRVVWFLRWLRTELAGRAKHTNSDTELNRLNQRLKTNFTSYDMVPITNLMTNLEHYLSLPIPQIQNVVWQTQSPRELLNDFHEQEEDWKEASGARLLRYPEGEEPTIVMKFPDGYAWFDLETAYCRQEGEAMGHCGNAAAYRHGDTVLSLRRLVRTNDGETHWYPMLTFILDENGYLGEMKGRGNDKPAEKYHPYIIALLRDPRIKGIKGGGYLASHNFRMSDLDDETREQLVKEKPDLAELWELYDRVGMTDQVLDRVSSGLAANDLDYESYDRDNKTFVVKSFRDFDRFIRDIYDDTVEKLLDVAMGESERQPQGTIEEEFIKTAQQLPPFWQEQFLRRAGMTLHRGESSDSVVQDAANRLIRLGDDWYREFEEVFNDSKHVQQEAWERLYDYASAGWPFAASHVYMNIPADNVENFQNFVEADESVNLMVDERALVGYASSTSEDEDDYGYDLMRMSSEGQPSWDNIDTEYLNDRRHEEDLTDSSGKDKWLSGLSKDEEGPLVDEYIAALQGKRRGETIHDPRQHNLKFESIRRHIDVVANLF